MLHMAVITKDILKKLSVRLASVLDWLLNFLMFSHGKVSIILLLHTHFLTDPIFTFLFNREVLENHFLRLLLRLGAAQN